MYGGVVAALDPVKQVKRFISKERGQPLSNESRVARGAEIKDQSLETED